mgnify:CR=1 FL=1
MKYSKGLTIASIVALASEISDDKLDVHVDISCTGGEIEVSIRFYSVDQTFSVRGHTLRTNNYPAAHSYTLDEIHYILAAISGLELAS